MNLTKLEVTKRHLDFAIDSYFSGKDLVPIWAVAGAAHILAHDLVQHTKPGSTWAQIGAEENDLTLADTLRKIRVIPNWVKHASSDPDSTLELFPEDIEFLLFHTMLDLGELNGKNAYHSNEISVFQLWFIAKHKTIFSALEYSELVRNSEECFPNLSAHEYSKQLLEGFLKIKKMRKEA